jgi:hypothetical protein
MKAMVHVRKNVMTQPCVAPDSGVVRRATVHGVAPQDVQGCDLWQRMRARALQNRSGEGRYRLHDGLSADRRRGCAITASLKW